MEQRPVGMLSIRAISDHHVMLELRDVESYVGLAIEISAPPAARAVLEKWASQGCVFRLDPHYPAAEYLSAKVCIDEELADRVDGIFEQK